MVALEGRPTSRPGDGWGLVCAVVRAPSAGHDLMNQGAQHWSGAAGTTLWVDPAAELVAVLFAQHQPFDEFSLHTRFRPAVYQAIPFALAPSCNVPPELARQRPRRAQRSSNTRVSGLRSSPLRRIVMLKMTNG